MHGKGKPMKKQSNAHSDRGSATAEYAIVTVAAAGFAAVLVALLKSPEVRDMLLSLVRSALGS
jgi:hypothetical protein